MREMRSTLLELKSSKDSDKSLQLFAFWRYSEIATVFFVVLSLISSTIDYELNYSSYRTYNNCYEEYTENINLRWLTFSSSIAAIISLLLGTYAFYLWEDYLYITDPRCRPHKFKRNYLKLVLEVLLLSIFPYAHLRYTIYQSYGVNEGFVFICYSIDEILYSIMWFRFYFILKLASSYSPFASHVARRLAIQNNAKTGFVFAFKCMFKSNPMLMIIFFIGIPTIIVIGMITRVYERPLIFLSAQDWVNPITAVWFSYSTMMLGVYGDFYPLSLYGRLTNFVAYMIGTLFFVMIFVNMQNQAFLSKRQRRAFNEISLMNEAADVIKCGMRYYISIKNYQVTIEHNFMEFHEKMVIFKNKRRDLFNMTRQRELDAVELRFSLRKSKKNMDKLYRKLEVVSHLINQKLNSNY